MEENKAGFLKRHWKIALVIFAGIGLLVLFIMLSGKTSVNPDLVYFPK